MGELQVMLGAEVFDVPLFGWEPGVAGGFHAHLVRFSVGQLSRLGIKSHSEQHYLLLGFERVSPLCFCLRQYCAFFERSGIAKVDPRSAQWL